MSIANIMPYLYWELSSSRPGVGVQIPGAAVQRGSDSQRDERSGEEEHPQNPRLICLPRRPVGSSDD